MQDKQHIKSVNLDKIMVNIALKISKVQVLNCVFISVMLTLFLSCKGQVKTAINTSKISINKSKVLADSISLHTLFLPEFVNDPHVKETQGNQISGVVRTVFQDTFGNFWFGTQDGLCRYDKNTLVYFDLKNDNGKGIVIKAIAEDIHGNIWFGHSSGISKYDGKYFTSYSEKNGLISNDVWSLTTDSKGIIWIGTIDGVCFFDGNIFTPFEIPKGKPDPTRGVTSAKIVHSIMEDSKGNIWFANNGGAYFYNGKIVTNIFKEHGLNEINVSHIMEDSNGNFWFATVHNGLYHYNGRSITNITDKLLVDNSSILSVLEDKKGHIWFVVNLRDIYRYNGSEFTKYVINKEKDLATFQIYEDQTDRLWFVGLKGAYRYDKKAFENITREGPW